MRSLMPLLILAVAAAPVAAQRDANIFDPADGLNDWSEICIVGQSENEIVENALRIRADASASVLEREIDLDLTDNPMISWQWRVDALPEGADIRTRTKDDMGAAVVFTFGEPTMFQPPETLMYVWASDAVNVGDIVTSARTSRVKMIVRRAGVDDLGKWVMEEVDLAADYEVAFGKPPPDSVKRVMLFTDADQTGSVSMAQYGAIKVR